MSLAICLALLGLPIGLVVLDKTKRRSRRMASLWGIAVSLIVMISLRPLPAGTAGPYLVIRETRWPEPEPDDPEEQPCST